MSTVYDPPNGMVVGNGSSNVTDRLAALAGVAEALVTSSKIANIKIVVVTRSIFMGHLLAERQSHTEPAYRTVRRSVRYAGCHFIWTQLTRPNLPTITVATRWRGIVLIAGIHRRSADGEQQRNGEEQKHQFTFHERFSL
jgi:hypothetical protein